MDKIRPVDDFYETPGWCTEAVLEREAFPGIIWEPACGYGAISKILKDMGLEVYSSDITYRGYGWGEHNFLEEKPKGFFDSVNHVITNPPFSLAEDFVRQSLSVTTNKVAMLLRLAFLESQKRKILFEETPLKTVYVFSKRITMYPADFKGEQKNGGTIAFAWFVWDHTYQGKPQLEWI